MCGNRIFEFGVHMPILEVVKHFRFVVLQKLLKMANPCNVQQPGYENSPPTFKP